MASDAHQNGPNLVTHPSAANPRHGKYGQLPHYAATRPKRVAVLLDGGFFTKRWRALHRSAERVAPADVQAHVTQVLLPALTNHELYRAFWYDANPCPDRVHDPMTGAVIDYAKTEVYRHSRAFLEAVEQLPFFAVRRGECQHEGWRLTGAAIKRLRQIPPGQPRALGEGDLAAGIRQKGVDLRIGIDVADIAFSRLADTVVITTGDSDFIPVLKLARRAGALVVLDTMGQGVYSSLRAHADVVLP